MERCKHGMLPGQCAWCHPTTYVGAPGDRTAMGTSTDPDLVWARDGGEGWRSQQWHPAHERELADITREEMAAMTATQRHAMWERLGRHFGRSHSAVWQRWYLLTREQS